MPTKVLPDAEAFGRFTRSLLRRGFRKLSRTEFRKDFERLELIAPSPREGSEVGFTYTANGLEVRVWTTFLAQEGRARDEDAGWVLIKEGDTPRYFARPMSRTRYFLYRLLWEACIAKWRVEHRPHCPVCHGRMQIAYGTALKSRFWQCVRSEIHARPIFLPWDYELPQAALEYKRSLRKERARYRSELREQGKSPGAALRHRIGWKVGRPENIEPRR